MSPAGLAVEWTLAYNSPLAIASLKPFQLPASGPTRLAWVIVPVGCSAPTAGSAGPNRNATTGPFEPLAPAWMWAIVSSGPTALKSNSNFPSDSVPLKYPMALAVTAGTSSAPESVICETVAEGAAWAEVGRGDARINPS